MILRPRLSQRIGRLYERQVVDHQRSIAAQTLLLPLPIRSRRRGEDLGPGVLHGHHHPALPRGQAQGLVQLADLTVSVVGALALPSVWWKMRPSRCPGPLVVL